MSKRVFSLILLFVCSMLLAGCNRVQDLTDEETKLIAEYAAGLLLQYDINYIDRIDEGNKEAAAEVPEAGKDESGSTEAPVTTEENTQDSSKGQNIDSKVDTSDAVTDMDSPAGTESDIAKIAGVSGASITYKDYLVTDQYPAKDEDGEFIYLEASKGYQLLVIRFKVANTGGNTVDISLLEKELNYRLVCNGNKTANPMLTILMDDLGTLETTINQEEEQEAVLVFQISDDMKDELETIELRVRYNDTDNMIQIL